MARAVYAEGTQFSEFGEEKDGVVKECSLSSRLLCGLKKNLATRWTDVMVSCGAKIPY